jgi:hypothetical protein
VIGGHGHCPLIPIIGRSNPSGDELTQPRFQFSVLVIGFGTLVGIEGIAVDEEDEVDEDFFVDDDDEDVIDDDDDEDVIDDDNDEDMVDDNDDDDFIDDADVLDVAWDVDVDLIDDADGAGATSPGVPPIRTRLSPVVQ